MRKFTNPILLDAAKKAEIENVMRQRDDLSLRVEMALMSGMARLLDVHLENSDGLPPFMRHLMRDLARLQQMVPREAATLRERLALGMQALDQTGSFKRTLIANEPGQLSTLAVR